MDPFLRCFLFKKGIVHCHSFLWFWQSLFLLSRKKLKLKTFSQVGTVDEQRHDNRGGQLDRLDNNEPEKHEVLVISPASASAEKLFPRSVPWVI